MQHEFYGITLLKETDFSAFGTELQLWDGQIPFEQGTKFPDENMQRRADINLTMDALISNEFQKTLSQFITTWPEIEPLTNRKVTNIVANLPIFDTVQRTWRLLLKACLHGVKIKGVNRPDIAKVILPLYEDLIKNMFSCCDRITHVYKKNNKIMSNVYSDKNIVLFRTRENDLVFTLSNIITDKNKRMSAEFLSYTPDGIVHDVFEYNAGRLGKHIVKNERIEGHNTVVFRRNGSGSYSKYGYPVLAGSISAALGTIRAFATFTNLVEKKKEMIRVVPDTMIRKDPYTGASALTSSGVGAYDSSNPDVSEHNHDVAFKVPQLAIDEAVKSLESMLKQVSIYSGLSGVILGYQNVTGRDSGRAIIASCVPTMIQATGYLADLSVELKEIIQKMFLLEGEELDIDDIELELTNPDKTLLDIVMPEEDLSHNDLDPTDNKVSTAEEDLIDNVQ